MSGWWGIDIGRHGRRRVRLCAMGRRLAVRPASRARSFRRSGRSPSGGPGRDCCSWRSCSLNFVQFMVDHRRSRCRRRFDRGIPSTHFMWNLFVLLIAWAVVANAIRGPKTEPVELDERDLRMQRSARPRRRLGADARRHRHRAAACLRACRAPGVVAVAADRRECADWPADRQIAGRTRVPGGALRARTRDERLRGSQSTSAVARSRAPK